MQIFLPWINYFFTKLPSYKQTTRWILYCPEYVFAFKLTTLKCVFAFVLFLMLRFLSLTNSAFFFSYHFWLYLQHARWFIVTFSLFWAASAYPLLSSVFFYFCGFIYIYKDLRLCKSYVFLLRNYFPQMSSHTLIYVEYFLIMAIKKHLLAHNL